MKKPDDPYMEAVDAALAGDWERAHRIVQERSDLISCWIHAVLHKIEGDVWNSKYWYGRSHVSYDDHGDPMKELEIIRTGRLNQTR